MIRQKLRKHPQRWGAIVALGACVKKGGRVDFQEWRRVVKDEERALVDELASVFAPLDADEAPRQ